MINRIDPTKDIFLQTDASDIGIGAVLFQIEGDQYKVLGIQARKLKKHERNYSTPKKETLAIVFGIKKLFFLLIGRKFNVLCDNESLSYSVKENSVLGWFIFS